MNRTLPCVLLALAISACGGGGGGGGSSSPANVNPGTGNNNGGGNQQQDLQTGVFTDAPVAGLRYRQGSQQGVTDADGQFTYDANSSEKVEFLIGNTSIGFATGAAAVTPFDLQSGPGSLNYHRGINVSRLLVSLDVDSNPTNGIEMPADIAGFAGSLPFDLEPSAFEQEPQLNRLLPLFNVTQLVSEADILDHLADNDIVVKKLDDARSRLDALGNVSVRWNPGLDSAGVLADIEASNGERLIILLGDAGGLHVDSVLYFDAAGRYALLGFERDRETVSANMDGVTFKTLTVNNASISDFSLMLDLPNYVTQNHRVQIDTSSGRLWINKGDGSTALAVHPIFERMVEGVAGSRDILNLAMVIMRDVEKAFCNTASGCSQDSTLFYGIQTALTDAQYASRNFHLSSVGEDDLQIENICLATDLFDDLGICGNGVALGAFIVNAQADASISVTQWESDSLVPWASGIFEGEFNLTTRPRKGHGQPSGVPTGSSDVPPPWIEAVATLEFRSKFLRLSNDYYHSEFDLVRISSPLQFRECAYVDSNNSGYMRPQCGAYSSSINSTERQAAYDAFDDLVRFMRYRSYLHVELETGRGSFQSASIDYFSDENVRGLYSLQRFTEFMEYFSVITVPVAEKILANLDRHYYYNNPDNLSNESLESGFGDLASIYPSQRLAGLSMMGLLIDERFDAGAAYVDYSYSVHD